MKKSGKKELPPLVLGLDLATHTGHCLSRGKTVLHSGTWDFSHSRDHAGSHNGHMFVDLLNSIQDTYGIEGYPYDLEIRVERAHHRGGPATRLALGLVGNVMAMCAECNIPFSDVHTSTLKKWATGNGKASKEEMMKRASELVGKEITDNDEADAILISLYEPDKSKVAS